MSKIWIDCREQDLIKLMEDKKVDITIKSLDIGDVIIVDENDVELLIIERKTIQDLEASIKDGRYEEQSYRLSGYEPVPNHNIVYLIEGNLEKHCSKKKEVMKKTLYSSLFSIMYYKGFSLIQSNSTEETAFIILNIFDKINRELKKNEKTPYYTENKEIKEYSSLIKKVKKQNITKENIDEIMLSQIPGVSVTFANAILLEYDTLANLIENIKTDNNCLKMIKYKNKKDKMQKISKTCCENIYHYLLKTE
jgi:ERCC4-type nuclease